MYETCETIKGFYSTESIINKWFGGYWSKINTIFHYAEGKIKNVRNKHDFKEDSLSLGPFKHVLPFSRFFCRFIPIHLCIMNITNKNMGDEIIMVLYDRNNIFIPSI